MSRISYSMMEAGCIPGNLGAFKKECGKIKLYGETPSSPDSTTTTQLSYPKELQGDVINMAKKAIAASNAGYIPYQGNRIQNLDPFQLSAQQAVANLGPSQQLGAATQFAGAAGMRAGDINYTPSQFQTGSFTQPGVAESYMSPYYQNVVDIQAREARRQADISNQMQNARSVGQGAFGGSRQAILQAEAQRNLGQQIGDIQARGSQAAFEQAQNLYGNEQQRALAAQQATEASRQYGAGLGLQGLQQQLQAAQMLGTLGQQQFGQQKDIINALQATGAQRQALNQQKLTQDYEDFLRQKQYPYQQLAYATEMVKGVPQQTTQSVYGAPPSLQAQLGGGLMSAYGLSKLFAGGGLADLGIYNLSKG
jgi:hypothetical protein